MYGYLRRLVELISHRRYPYHVMHVRSHTDLPGFIAEGNRRADFLAAPVEEVNTPDRFAQAWLSHQFFHQNVLALMWMFHLSHEEARGIVATCPSCQNHQMPSMHVEVNPRGMTSCQIWQVDVTHVESFGKFRYVHVHVDTFSHAVFATPLTGEKAKDAIKHLCMAFSVLGVPKIVKMDNSPCYASQRFKTFLNKWGVRHITGVPHSPTGQAIVERTHLNIKRILQQQHGETEERTPVERLCKALFTLNFLNSSAEEPFPKFGQK